MTIICLLNLLEGKLLGDHVCRSEITVPQEAVQWELKNRTTRTYKWCVSVPPRCSEYSNSIVNETKVTVINVTKTAEVCCEGYMEQNNICISQCQDCQNGLCIRGVCMCQTGWNGPRCDYRATTTTTTPTTSVSRNTVFRTTMSDIFERNNLVVSSSTILEGRDASQTTKLYTVEPDENVMTSAQRTFTDDYSKSKFTYNDNVVSPTADLTYRSNSLEVERTSSPIPATSNSNVDLAGKYTRKTIAYTDHKDSKYRSDTITYLQTSTLEPYFDTTVTEPIHIPLTEKKLMKNMELIASSVETVESSLDYREIDRDIFIRGTSVESNLNVKEKLNKVEGIDTKSTTFMPQAVLTKPSTIENYEIENITSRGNTLETFEERFEKRSSIEKLMKNPQLTFSEPTSYNMIYSVCAASVTTFFILVVVITLYAVRNSRKKFEKHKPKKDVATVAVYTTSIFHSPLPDPPMFDNPTYLATRTNRGSWNQDKRESIEIQELNVIFEKPVANTKLDSKQYFYDHPPSTGSYRASSEVDSFSHYNLSQKSMSGIVVEPLYDEIPSKPSSIMEECDVTDRNRSGIDAKVSGNADSNCLYMNTCGRTKF